MKIFVSYCHQNSDWVDDEGKYQLIPWLKNQLGENVSFWTDHILKDHVGEEYRKHIYDNIQDSDIALLLISQEFTSSKFIYHEELPWIRERFVKDELKIIPLLISHLSKGGREKIAWIFDLQTIPNNIRPLLDYISKEDEFYKMKIAILNALEEKIENITKRPPVINEPEPAVDPEPPEVPFANPEPPVALSAEPESPATPPHKPKPSVVQPVEPEPPESPRTPNRNKLKYIISLSVIIAILLLGGFLLFPKSNKKDVPSIEAVDINEDLVEKETVMPVPSLTEAKPSTPVSEEETTTEKEKATTPKPTSTQSSNSASAGSSGSSEFKRNTAKYDYVGKVYYGMARVRLNEKTGWVNSRGEEIIPCMYESSHAGNGDHFEKGANIQTVKYRGKWGAIDKMNNIIIPFEYDDVSPFLNGLMHVRKNGYEGFIDEKNTIVIPLIYQRTENFFDKTVWAQKDDKWGCIDRQNNIIIDFIYDKLIWGGRCKENEVYVIKDGKMGIINSITGQITEPLIHDEDW